MINGRLWYAIAGLCLLMGCRNKLEDIAAVNPVKNTTQDRATDVTIIYSTNARIEARLFAKEFVRAEMARPPYTDAEKGVLIEFYDSLMQVQTRVSAKYARLYEVKGNVLLRDSIRVENNKGERLETEELVWNDGQKKFFTEKPVSIQTKTQTLTGTGLEANQDFTKYRILNLTGVVQVSKTAIPS